MPRPARRDAVREWLELRADERRGGLFFGRGDDGLVLVVGAADAAVLDEFAERFEVRIGVVGPDDVRRLLGRRSIRRASPATGALDPSRTSPTSRAPACCRWRRRPRRARWPRPRSRRSCDHDREHGTALLETRARVARRTTARTRRPPAPSVCTATPCAPGSQRRSGRWTPISARSRRAPSSGPRCASRPDPHAADRPADSLAA